MFQSTPARGGRPAKGLPKSRRTCFNPRPHVAGDQYADQHGGGMVGFNPRPHVAGDDDACHADDAKHDVSIHARTWRATRRRSGHRAGGDVSIHARTWRATIDLSVNGQKVDTFQSTPARGGRRSRCRPCPTAQTFQSTPARGGRPWAGVSLITHPGFNPRPHVAGDRKPLHRVAAYQPFQSTPARGGRHSPAPSPYRC